MTVFVDAIGNKGYDVNHSYHISANEYRGAKTFFQRIILRIRMYIIYPVHLIARMLLEKKGSIWIVCTNTFYAPFVAAVVSKLTGVKVVHLLYDLYPEVLGLAGVVKRKSCLWNIFHFITNQTISICSRNVYLGKHLKKYIDANYSKKNSYIIPVGADGRPFLNDPPKKNNPNEPTVLMYCGNMGFMHEIDTLASGIKKWANDGQSNIRFVFHSSGAQYRKFSDSLRGVSPEILSLGGGLPEREWVDAMKGSAIGISTMIEGAEKVLMPSKTYSAMVAGQAILAVCPLDSDLAELIFEHECGWVVQPGDMNGLLDVFKEISEDHDAVWRKRTNSYMAGHKYYECEAVAQQWINMIEEM
jgi:glycosyltransferase involved in cell wall biosynthesis